MLDIQHDIFSNYDLHHTNKTVATLQWCPCACSVRYDVTSGGHFITLLFSH